MADLTRFRVHNQYNTSQIIQYDDARIQWLGRWEDTGSGKLTSWGGSQIVFKVIGTSRIIVMASVVDPDTTTNMCLMESYIDNDPAGTLVYDPAVYKASNFYYLTTLADKFTGNVFQQIDLPDTGEHSVILHTNGVRSGMWARTQKTIITGFILDYGGVISTWTQGTKVLQCVGDSWMAADVAFPRLMDRTRWNLYPISHGGLSSGSLNTDYNSDYSGHTSPTDTTADVVIVCEDVNDYNFSVTTATHQANIGALLDKIRVRQPSAPIVLLGAPDNTGASKTFGTTYNTVNAAAVAARSNCYYHSGIAMNAALSSYWMADTFHLDGTGRQLLADDIDAYLTMTLSRDSALTLNSGENLIYGCAVDSAGGYAYYVTYTSPAIVVKVSLADNTRVGALTLNSGENSARGIYLDTTNGFGYINCATSPSIIVKIKLSDFTRVGALTLNSGENTVVSGALDIANGNSYWGDNSSPAKIIKVNNNGTGTPTRTSSITLSTNENSARGLIIDSGNLYVATSTTATRVVKISLSTFTRTSAITLSTGENSGYCTAVDTTNSFLYVGCATSPSIVVKVNLSTFTRTAALTLNTGENSIQGLAWCSANAKLFCALNTSPGKIVEIGTAGFTRNEALTLNTGENSATACGLDTSTKKLWVGLYLSPSVSICVVTNNSYLSATKQSLTLTTYASTLTKSYEVAATKQSLILTTYTVSFGTVNNINATKQSLILTTYAAALTKVANVLCNVRSLTLTANAATITLLNTTIENFSVTLYDSTGAKQTGQTVYMEAYNNSNEQYDFVNKVWATPNNYKLTLLEFGETRAGYYEEDATVTLWDGEIDVHIWYVSTENSLTVNYDYVFEYVDGVRVTLSNPLSTGLTGTEHAQLMSLGTASDIATTVWSTTLPL
jgi:hypothetical protein